MTEDPDQILALWRENREMFAGVTRNHAPAHVVTIARAGITSARAALAVSGWTDEQCALIAAEIDVCERKLDELTGGAS